MTEAYPLAWPAGWPRSAHAERKNGWAAFKRQVNNGRYTSGQPWTFAQARDALLEEVWKHRPTSVVLSSNFQPGKNGPTEGRRRPEDEGIAVYFQRSGKPYVVACDRYHDAEGNMRSLTLGLEALRALERHGGGTMMERAYEGFVALAAPGPRPWRDVLGVGPAAGREDVLSAYRRLAAERHPDRGGSDHAMAELNTARDAALKEFAA